jgi:hypothetical protein
MQRPMTKNKRRRLRREEYYGLLEGSLADERGFVRRVIAALDHHGLDIAPDGRPIKAGFWGFIKQRQQEAERNRSEEERRRVVGSSLACLDLMERALQAVAVKGIPKKDP